MVSQCDTKMTLLIMNLLRNLEQNYHYQSFLTNKKILNVIPKEKEYLLITFSITATASEDSTMGYIKKIRKDNLYLTCHVTVLLLEVISQLFQPLIFTAQQGVKLGSRLPYTAL